MSCSRSSSVPNGETALAAAYAARPNLVVLDVALSGVSAYEVCRSLRYVDCLVF
jgi:DNA-binding response OmpR family regulator